MLRDDRGVPHIIAPATTTCFLRRDTSKAPTGSFKSTCCGAIRSVQLAEVFGGAALATDESSERFPCGHRQRAVARLDDYREIPHCLLRRVNAAIVREPLPVEFRLLAYRPRPWTPQDSLAIGMAEVLDLIDDWNAVASRDAAYRRAASDSSTRFPFTDPCYDHRS